MRIAAAALLALSACHSVPELNGASLLCDDDASCPDGMRCYQGGCIRNAAPSIRLIGVVFATVGQPITLRITYGDAEVEGIDENTLAVYYKDGAGNLVQITSV
ncbi:MAG: hypothetical protein HYZ27_04755, partial [Deltaproteobacteria bacterium]|nr:hypothetical protein [Deltaproteobacteria bacterium]